ASPPSPATESLPFWMEAAIRLGRRFYRIAAAGVPPASSGLMPHGKHAGVCCVECGCVHPALVDEYYFWLVEGQYYSEPANPTLAGSSGSTSSTTGSYQYGF